MVENQGNKKRLAILENPTTQNLKMKYLSELRLS